MPNYRVTWVIELDAESPREAAWKALDIQRDPVSIATVFDVQEILSPSCKVDLEDNDDRVESALHLRSDSA